MLLKLLPTQVNKYWGVILEGVKAGLPPETIPDTQAENRLLKSLTSDTMQVWLIVDGAAAIKVRALILTTVVSDEITKTRDMLLFCTHSFVPVKDEVWLEVDKELVSIARKNRCDRLVAYTREERVIQLMQICGYDTSYRFVYKELSNG